MKKGLMIGVCLLIAAAIGVTAWLVIPGDLLPTKEDVARVDGVFITKEQVNNALTYNQIQMEIYQTVFFANFASKEEAQKYLDASALKHPTTQEGVITFLIRAQVLWEYLKEQEKEISKEEAVETYDAEIAALEKKEINTYYTTLEQVLAANQTTMEEFIALGREYSFAFYNTMFAKAAFKASNEYDETSYISLEEQFATFADELVKKANVERFS